MFNVTKKSMQWGEETLTLETGKVARDVLVNPAQGGFGGLGYSEYPVHGLNRRLG